MGAGWAPTCGLGGGSRGTPRLYGTEREEVSRDVRSRLWLVVEPRACGGSAEAWVTDALVVEKLMSEGKPAVGVDQPLSPWSSVTTFPLMNVTSNDKGHGVEAVVSRATEAACAFWTKRGTGCNKGKGEGDHPHYATLFNYIYLSMYLLRKAPPYTDP